MDPFSVVGLIGSSLNGIIKTKEWIEGIRRAPQSVAALSSDLRTIERLLGELGSLLNSADEDARDNASRLVRDAINNCEDLSHQIAKTLRPFVNSHGSGFSTWKRLAFTFRESDVLHLQREMGACKQTLNMAIGCANLLATQRVARGMKRVQRHFGIETSSVADSDIAERNFERTQQWISQSGTLIEDRDEDDGSSPRESPDSQEVALPGNQDVSRANGVGFFIDPWAVRKDPTATTLFDYEAAEGNELSFPEGAKITGIEFPDPDWWYGHYQGTTGLFPANYVELDVPIKLPYL